MKSLFLSVFLYTMLETVTAGSAFKSLKMDCKADVDRGDNTSCRNPRPAIHFYHDDATDICFPFLYKGCGGNNNRYDSMNDCYMACPPGLMFHCLGKTTPTGVCNRNMDNCPKGSVCLLRSFGTGICCDMEDEDRWLRDFECHCRGNEWEEEEWNDVEHLLGKDCEHEFCPAGFKCVKGYHLAHCCRR